MARNSQEYRTLLGATYKLTRAVQNNITPLCAGLVARDLITPDNQTALRNRNVDVVDRAADLVSLVTTKVEQCADNYHIFVKILIEDRATYKEVLKVLEPIYKDPDEAPPSLSGIFTSPSLFMLNSLPCK